MGSSSMLIRTLIADACWITRSSGGVGVLAQILVPQICAVHDARLEVANRARPLEWRPIDVDGLVSPGAGRAELSPGADVLLRPPRRALIPAQAVPAAASLRTEDSVELLQGQLPDRI